MLFELWTARIPLQIDIGFGDTVVPGPQNAEYPTLLGSFPPKLRVYPKETVIAEKFEALVTLGIANSRMKDFYDLYVIFTSFPRSSILTARSSRARSARLSPGGRRHCRNRCRSV
jgi:hypothetical protein